MHLVRLDIDKKNAASQYHVGPLGAGLNAIYSPLVANSTLLTRFTKSLLFRGQTLGEFDDSEFASIDGSLTWVDASGHLRMLDCAGGKPLLAQITRTLEHRNTSNSLNAPTAFQDDDERIRGSGNMFWEGQGEDHRWDELRADLLSMIFCSPLGSVSPEKLWWGASKLGVHCAARRELDDGYKHLKDEESSLLSRLRDSDPVDHDQTWWIAERERLRAELQYVQLNNTLQVSNTSPSVPLDKAPASANAQQQATQPQAGSKPVVWDHSQLSQQLSHAELMIDRWNQRAQWHQRLAQVQSLLQTRSPYRRISSGSLIPTAERFLSELTAGAVRQLPAWAMEASYMQAESMNAGLQIDSIDTQLPPAQTRQRRLVDLAIRLAIAQSARSRIGRIPFMLEHSIDGFRGEPLEQILHVLANFSRDGWQVLLITADEHIARRIAGHGGCVARVHENLRYAKPHYVIDSDTDLGLHPVLDRAPMLSQYRAAEGSQAFHDYREVNRHLDGLAFEHEHVEFEQNGQFDPWQLGNRAATQVRSAPVVVQRNGKTYYLSDESAVDCVPGLGTETLRRLRSVGVHRVSDLFAMSLSRLAQVTGLRSKWLQNTLSVAELMCKVPQMRVFDARVLVACGICNANDLASHEPLVLAKRVHRFLSTDAGRMLRKTSERGELVRLRTWIQTVYQQNGIRTLNDGDSVDFDWDRLQRKSNRTAVVRMAKTETDTDSVEEDPDVREDAGESVSEFTIHPGRPDSVWKFYLDLNSPVVDAPTIGPKMAEKLHAIEVKTIGDLLGAVPSEIADALGEKSVTLAVVENWQAQSMLVCRIPNLRGQDAQLLVAAGYRTAEAVAEAKPDALYDAIVRTASTKQGLRFLRGGNPPDRQRVRSWIEWSKHSRAVKAA